MANEILVEQISGEYKYGFVTDIEADNAPKGLNEDIIRFISKKKNEPEWMLEYRLKAFRYWLTLEEPHWAHVSYTKPNFQDIIYYSAPKPKVQLNSLDEVDPELLKTFEKLGISIEEQKIIPFSERVSLKVVFTETLSITMSTAILLSTPLKRFCSSIEIPSFSKVFNNSGSTSSRLFNCTLGFGAE